MLKPKVSAIIPAYNEGRRIMAVLKVLQNHPLVDEIIVVNDGSEDDTLRFIKSFHDIKIISYEKNMGKSYAVSKGIEKSRNDLLMLLDADLIGLKKDNITSLLKPVLEGEAGLSISLRKNGPLFAKIISLDIFSGERVFSKKLINLKEVEKLPGFGLEVYINKKTIEKRLKVKIVKWDVTQPVKTVKFGLFNGIKEFYKMAFQIINTIGFFKMLFQILKIDYLKVK